jgi:hypothetical protein
LGNDPGDHRDLPQSGRRRRARADTLPIMLQVNGNVTAEPLDERGPLLGSTDQVAADLDQAAKLGIEHVYWNSDDDPLSQLPLLERLRRG